MSEQVRREMVEHMRVIAYEALTEIYDEIPSLIGTIPPQNLADDSGSWHPFRCDD